MNETVSRPGPELNGKEWATAVTPPAALTGAETIIPIEEELADEVIVGPSSAVFQAEAEVETATETAVPAAEPPFDALDSLTRLLVGGLLEGSAELAERLEMWETYLRQEMEEGGPPVVAGQKDLARYALVGLAFESEEAVRRGLSRLWTMQKRLAQTAVRPARPLANSRLMRPIQARLDRAAERGQAELVRWVQRGQLEEPVSRELARLAFGEVVDEFIQQLAANKEVQELVQQQSVGLASEMVDQVRQRTFTADTLVERLARAVTRRAPRLESPPADLSEFHEGPFTPLGRR